jgi:hypothetical protein
MTIATKTVNPLHFEDLEPHRFEDLVRQLVYDFRDWANLEATGTSGSDDGFDARGRELIYNINDIDEEEAFSSAEERIWLIQCKREKVISPSKIRSYLKDIFSTAGEPLYGVIFVAACNFSKKVRDEFISEIRKNGIREFQLWGKSELEDLMFQPKNDHLLFAYFGISLSLRKRSLKTQLRSRIATKKKALKAICNNPLQHVLLRDSSDTVYPYKDDIANFEKRPPWKVYEFKEEEHNGVKFHVKKYLAYLADDRIHFDYVEDLNMHHIWEDPWNETRFAHRKQHPIEDAWRKIPDQNRAFLEVFRVVSYENILAIDDDGDNHFRGPHFYVTFSSSDGPFEPYSEATLSNCVIGNDRIEIYPNIENRIRYFKK